MKKTVIISVLCMLTIAVSVTFCPFRISVDTRPYYLEQERQRMMKQFAALDPAKITRIVIEKDSVHHNPLTYTISSKEVINTWITLMQRLEYDVEEFKNIVVGGTIAISFFENDQLVCSVWFAGSLMRESGNTIAMFPLKNFDALKADLEVACAMIDKDLRF